MTVKNRFWDSRKLPPSTSAPKRGTNKAVRSIKPDVLNSVNKRNKSLSVQGKTVGYSRTGVDKLSPLHVSVDKTILPCPTPKAKKSGCALFFQPIIMNTALSTISNKATDRTEASLMQQALAQRLRDWRAKRGMSRKILARDADVSERYLAQMEAGTGNVSLLLLERISHALHVPLVDLLADEIPTNGALRKKSTTVKSHLGWRQAINKSLDQMDDIEGERWLARIRSKEHTLPPKRLQRIALVGLRGAGKSALGGALATAKQYPFIELDRLIETSANMGLAEIFLQGGQAAYRNREHDCLEELIHLKSKFVLATGGSIVTEADTWHYLRQHCYVIWLKASPEEHMARVLAQKDFRPMHSNREAMNDLQHILTVREPYYQLADWTLDTRGESLERCRERLLQHILSLEDANHA